jgi:hypothetical protein
LVEDGRLRYRVRMKRPVGAENLTDAYATFDPGWGMVATKIDLRSASNGMEVVERFEGRGYRRMGEVWLPAEGIWESQIVRSGKVVSGRTEVSRFLDLKVNDPTVDLALNLPKGEWVKNRDTGQMFEVAEDGSLRPRSPKRLPTSAIVSATSLVGVLACLGLATLARRRT